MKIALVSLNQRWEDKEQNFQSCLYYASEAKKQNVNLIIFPEMTLTGFSMNIATITEDESSSDTIQKFKQLSKDYNISVVFGLAVKYKNKAQNRLYFIDEATNTIEYYVKIHPFSFAKEDRFYSAGNSLKNVSFMGSSFGLTICFDLRFPELYSALATQSDFIINIANWPSKRTDHWDSLLKARAIENQLYIIGVNRQGSDGNSLDYDESSVIYNANGKEESYEKFQEMKIYSLDKKWTSEFKKNFNTQNDRKNELYKKVL